MLNVAEPVMNVAEPVLNLFNLLNLRCKMNPRLKMKCARFKNVHKKATKQQQILKRSKKVEKTNRIGDKLAHELGSAWVQSAEPR